MSARTLRAAVRELSVFSKLAAIEAEVATMSADAVLDAIAATARLGAALSARSIALAAQEGREAEPPSSALLSAKEAAARLRLSLPTIYRLAKSGELPAVRVCDAVRFDPADLARFVTARKSG